jgi:NADPH-dependent glutamate synthase beta subunit-like oxidoreductase
MQDGRFDAVFVAVGAQQANHLNIPAVDGKKLMDAVGLLGEVKKGGTPKLGRAVAVIGGGDVAMDAARTARRLGAEDAVLVYRRDESHLGATPGEAGEAFAEGVKVKWLSTVEQFGADGIVIEKVEMKPDGSVTPTGETERLAADAVVLAVGQHSDLSLLRGVHGVRIGPGEVVLVDENLMTGHPGIFAGGDCIGGARTMTAAVGHGKRAARAIDAWMRGQTYQHPVGPPVVTFDMLHLLDYLDAPRSQQHEVPPALRTGFGEVVAGLGEAQARYEAQRCLSCGNCFECDNCYAACPEQAITRLGPGHGYEVDLTLCTGCATCFEQCPCHAIEMVPEPTDSGGPLGSLGEPLAPSQIKVRD